MKHLIRSSLTVPVIALLFAACTTNEAPRVASNRLRAAGAGQPGYTMPPAQNVQQSQGGAVVLQLQQRAPGNAHL